MPGSKTAVLTQARKLGDELETRKADLAASTQAAIVEVLLKKSLPRWRRQAWEAAGGGWRCGRQPVTCANQLNDACARRGVRVHYPELHLCTDNGAMIAMAAAMRLQTGANGQPGLRLRREAPLAAGRNYLISSCVTVLGGTSFASVSVSTPFVRVLPRWRPRRCLAAVPRRLYHIGAWRQPCLDANGRCLQCRWPGASRATPGTSRVSVQTLSSWATCTPGCVGGEERVIDEALEIAVKRTERRGNGRGCEQQVRKT